MATATRKSVQPSVFRFAGCEVDLDRREIRRHGIPVPAEPKTFELLVYLIENRDRAIEKNEIQQAVWAGASVTAAAVTRCVMKARRLVGDDSKHQAIVKTVHGHGYHFIATLDDPSENKTTAASSPTIEAYEEALRIPDRLSIAVLPFKERGGDPDQEYFAEGITDDVITELSRFSSLFVISPDSTSRLKDSSEDAHALSRRLDVAYIVQGSVHRSGSRIRITVHLTESTSERRLWSEHYDRELQELPIIHDDVSRTIAATIGGRVEAHRARQPLDEAGVKAYDLILRAKALHFQNLKLSNAEARVLLERAIEIDPDNARAHAWLASAHAMDSWYRWAVDPDESERLALEFGHRAVEMDDSEPIAHSVYGEILYCQFQFELGESHLERALMLNPNDISPRGVYCGLLVSSGRAKEAYQHLAVLERLDPIGVAWTPWTRGVVMFAVGRYEDALRALREVEQINISRLWMAATYAKLGDIPQARLELEKFLNTARDEMGSFPGKDEETWRNHLRCEMIYRYEKDFQVFYQGILQAGWLDLLDALPDDRSEARYRSRMFSEFVKIEAALDAAGLNLRGALSVDCYDGIVPGAWQSSALLPDAHTALVVASGGRALWTALRVAAEFDAASDPVDTYTARVLGDLARDLCGAGYPSRALYPLERRGGAWADFVALGREAGLGVSSRLGLILHPVYGPWMSIRAVLLTALECPFGTPIVGFDPCSGCAAPCVEACPGGAVGPEGISAHVCEATQRTEPACALRCSARRACGVGAEHAYAVEAEAHHMRS